jgi:hypothetical protein
MDFDDPLLHGPAIETGEQPFSVHLNNPQPYDGPKYFLEYGRSRKDYIAWKAAHAANMKAHPGLVAFRVCRESRAISKI